VIANSAATLSRCFDPRENSLNALRLALATMVIVSHAWPVTGRGADPGFAGTDVGDWSVAGFFAISGYLITTSRLRSHSLRDYFWRRVLRIYPAFIVCLLVIAFVFAPMGAMIGPGTYAAWEGGSFVVNNLALLIRQFSIGDTLSQAPFPDSWVGPLWTLFYEFACYIGIALLVTVAKKREQPLRALLWVGFAGCTAINLWSALGTTPLSARVTVLSALASFFLAGALLNVHRSQTELRRDLLAVASLTAAGGIALGLFYVIAPLPLAYVALTLGTSRTLSRVGARNDISYGIYIYGFPVEQTMELALPGLPLALYLLGSITIATGLAWASWLLVEKPALRLKSLTAPELVLRSA